MQMHYRLKEGLFLIAIALSVFLFISLATYHAVDAGWSSSGTQQKILNWGGRVGAFIADIFFLLFGGMAYIFPFLMGLLAWLGLQAPDQTVSSRKERMVKVIGMIFLIVSVCSLMSFFLPAKSQLPADLGGIIGDVCSRGLSHFFNKTGSTLFFITLFLCGVTLLTGLSWLAVINRIVSYLLQACRYLYIYVKSAVSQRSSAGLTIEMPSLSSSSALQLPLPMQPQSSLPSSLQSQRASSLVINMPAPIVMPPVVVPKLDLPKERKKVAVDSHIKLSPGTLPPLSLLNPPAALAGKPFANISFEELSQLVELRLSDFGVEVKVVAVHPGPVVTRFELSLAPGIKVSKITGLAKDIARSLSAVSVRVVEVIPGKSVIGLEIPNENREMVTLRDMLASQRFVQSRSPVSLVLGKDIAGLPVVVDLIKMPHLLVAGTTGAGKSVSLNAMLLSMLFKSTPEQLRLILIDPKMLELSIYEGIPHLLTPVITDMKDAANALRWCVAEMDKRYRLMAALGVRNVAGYNQKVNEAIKQGQPLLMPGVLVTDEASARTYLKPMPLVVVIADELADMMMVVGKKVEELIARIAQKARAAGIHLILATQRPSVDVITGLIKANIPTRIAFQVSSRIDSRTILDQQGAEQLLGHGDMLYMPSGAGLPIRVHGAYVADEEVHRVVAAWRSYGEPQYLTDITTEKLDNGAEGSGGAAGEQDPLYDQAVRIVTETRRASISLVQRRLRIGYNRAARMMEDMEAAGVVSGVDNNGGREVLAAPPVEAGSC